MKDVLIVLAVLVVMALALGYVIREKKKGKKCIGCPTGGNCSSCAGKDGCNVGKY